MQITPCDSNDDPDNKLGFYDEIEDELMQLQGYQEYMNDIIPPGDALNFGDW